jgi:hypothetical protein
MARHSVSSTGSPASKSLHWEQNYGEHICRMPSERSEQVEVEPFCPNLVFQSRPPSGEAREGTNPVAILKLANQLCAYLRYAGRTHPRRRRELQHHTLGDKAASEDWLLYDRLMWNSEKFIELFAKTARARNVGHRLTTRKKVFVDNDLLSQERNMSMDQSVWNTEKRQILSICVAALRLERENSKSKRTHKPKKANSDPSTPAEPSKNDQQADAKGGSVIEDNSMSRPATASVHVNEKSIASHEEMPSETSPGDDTWRLADKNVPKENEITVADTDNESGAYSRCSILIG